METTSEHWTSTVQIHGFESFAGAQVFLEIVIYVNSTNQEGRL